MFQSACLRPSRLLGGDKSNSASNNWTYSFLRVVTALLGTCCLVHPRRQLLEEPPIDARQPVIFSPPANEPHWLAQSRPTAKQSQPDRDDQSDNKGGIRDSRESYNHENGRQYHGTHYPHKNRCPQNQQPSAAKQIMHAGTQRYMQRDILPRPAQRVAPTDPRQPIAGRRFAGLHANRRKLRLLMHDQKRAMPPTADAGGCRPIWRCVGQRRGVGVDLGEWSGGIHLRILSTCHGLATGQM